MSIIGDFLQPCNEEVRNQLMREMRELAGVSEVIKGCNSLPLWWYMSTKKCVTSFLYRLRTPKRKGDKGCIFPAQDWEDTGCLAGYSLVQQHGSEELILAGWDFRRGQTQDGLYCWTPWILWSQRMVLGLTNAPATFQHLCRQSWMIFVSYGVFLGHSTST